MNQPLLTVNNLKMHFPIHGGILLRQIGNVYAVDGVSFSVNSGETVGVVGESGCGKSTIAKCLLQLHKPTSGEVIFEGNNILGKRGKELRDIRRNIQMIFQDPYSSLNARHTVGYILEEPFIIHNILKPAERRREVLRLLDKVGLPSSAMSRFPHEFSGGQRQRIGIARAISLKPKLIVCDEPVSALDVSIQSQILNLLLELQNEMQLTYIFIAHDLAVVRHISDRIAVMYLGKIVEFTDADSIYAGPAHPYTQALISAIPEPDPGKKTQRQILQGDVPSPVHPPSGCRFHTRCAYAKDICKTTEPELKNNPGTSEEKHLVACHFAGKLQKN